MCLQGNTWSRWSHIYSSLFRLFFLLDPGKTRSPSRPRGQKISRTMDKCEPCASNQYRDKRGKYTECLNCSPCGRHSEITSKCTPIKNTDCSCRKDFQKIHGRCVCMEGSGIEKSGGDICVKCKDGTFSNTTDSTCQPWRKCDQNGEKIPGSDISDVVCKNATKPEEPVPSSIISPNFVPQTSTKTSVVSWPTPSSSLADTTSAQPSRKKHGLWLGPLGAILALLFIQFVIIRMKPIKWFNKNKQQIIQQDSTCRKPVEESGEKCLLPSV
ncbi:tumor necrosis factor receptor superfamily member 1B isoform X2 [Brachyhypopomus gauderio]|uniref:tumor necrosis factor receptor superfamily member 1B isoform X2 n=1 Tax=Brachyhypopomus gauderio TaxID=698409 RepID=UPI0040416FD8